MSDKKDTWLDIILGSLLIVKVVWITSIFSHFISKKFFHNKYENMIVRIMDMTYNISTLFIGILMIYLYNHLTSAKVCISGSAKTYLYSFGLIACIGVIQKMFHKYYFAHIEDIENYINSSM